MRMIVKVRDIYTVYYERRCISMNKLKVVGLLASIVGAAATVVGNIVSDKQTDEKIAEKVAKALADSQK